MSMSVVCNDCADAMDSMVDTDVAVAADAVASAIWINAKSASIVGNDRKIMMKLNVCRLCVLENGSLSLSSLSLYLSTMNRI